MIMIFGLPGAALAMYQCAKDEVIKKSCKKSLFISGSYQYIDWNY